MLYAIARASAIAAPPAAKREWPVGRPIAAFSVCDALALALVDVAFADPLILALAEAEAEAKGVTEAAVPVMVNAVEVTGTTDDSTDSMVDVPFVVVHVT